MNAVDILQNGHQTVVTAVANLPEAQWQLPGACGYWSIKDILAHLASFEQLLLETLTALADPASATPLLNKLLADEAHFNDAEVARRQFQTPAETWHEYEVAHETAVARLANMPPTLLAQNGVLAWYGDDYDLEDFLVYTYYGHKREHCAQIDLFRDKLATEIRTV